MKKSIKNSTMNPKKRKTKKKKAQKVLKRNKISKNQNSNLELEFIEN